MRLGRLQERRVIPDTDVQHFVRVFFVLTNDQPFGFVKCVRSQSLERQQERFSGLSRPLPGIP